MRLTLCDVGPRDGLQNEAETLEPATRAELVDRLAAAGLPRVEAVSFVRPDRVPQMTGAEEVAAGIERRDGTEYSGLVLNEQGYERFRECGLDRVNVTLGATEEFNRRNANATLDEAVARVERILGAASEPATVTLSVAFGCPFEGRVDPGRVAELAARFEGTEVVLADTIGVAVPSEVRALVERSGAAGFHGHNTRNTGYANVLAAFEAGARVLDASVGGLGGCPYAPRASGNVATEDVVYLLEREGVETGVDLDAVIAVAAWLEGIFGRKLEGQVYRAGTWPATGRTDWRLSRCRQTDARSISSSPVCQFETETRIALRPRQVVPLSQTRLLSCTCRSTSSVCSSDSNRKSTWLSTTSFSSSTPGSSAIASEKRVAASQQRSTSSTTPERPSERSAA